MELILVPLCLVVGYSLGSRVARRARFRPRVTRAALRPMRAPETGYRDSAVTEPVHSCGDLLQTLRVAGLAVHEKPHGIEVTDPVSSARVELHIPDRARVTLASLDVLVQANDTLVFEVALALVPLFGPITVTETAWGTFVVDGTRTAQALADERSDRIRAIGAAIAEDMKEKAAVYGGAS